MHKRVWPTVVLSVGIVILLSVSAAAGQEPPVFELPEVVIPGRRPQLVVTTPAYVTVLSSEELQRLGFQTLGDALQLLSETFVRAAGGGPGGVQQPSIRGSTPQQVLVLIDGVPLNATAQFGVNLSTIALADVERVEVLRGPYSAIYGSGALGGVIQVTTRTGGRPQLSASAGSYGTARTSVRLAGTSAGSSYGAGAEYFSTAGDRPNGDVIRWTGTGKLVFELKAGQELALLVHRTSAHMGLPGSTLFPTPLDRQADSRTVVSLTWTQQTANPTRRQARVWWLGDALHSTSPGFLSDSDGSAHGVEWQSVTQHDRGAVLTWGVEWQQARFQLTSIFGGSMSGFQSEGSTAAVYVQYDILVRGRTFAGIGLRYDAHSVYGTQLNPRLGFVHFVSPTARVRASIGQTFRGPTFGELFYPGCSNPNLAPERAWSGDLGVEAMFRPGLTLRVNGFYTDAADLIVGGCAPTNVGSARVAGLSVEAVGRFSERWAINANLTWSDGVDRTTGLALLRLPPVQASVVLRYAPSAEQAVSVVARYVSAMPDLDVSTFPAARVILPGYATVGLRYERIFGPVMVRAGVDNLFDARYETLRGYPGSGRIFYVQIGSEF